MQLFWKIIFRISLMAECKERRKMQVKKIQFLFNFVKFSDLLRYPVFFCFCQICVLSTKNLGTSYHVLLVDPWNFWVLPFKLLTLNGEEGQRTKREDQFSTNFNDQGTRFRSLFRPSHLFFCSHSSLFGFSTKAFVEEDNLLQLDSSTFWPVRSLYVSPST